MRSGYSVTVFKNGEPLVTIEREMLSGQDPLSTEDTDAIRECGEHLTSFAGPQRYCCFVCGGEDRHEDDCSIAR